jgi:phosphate transport system protein
MGIHIVREIEKLKKMILSLSAVVERSVQHAVASIEAVDSGLAEQVVEADARIDAAEIDVEEECLKILALHQPVAIDLRMIVSVLKINNDLERIGDLAVNIAERTLALAGRRRVEAPFDFADMSEKTLDMLRRSLDSLMGLDAALALSVPPMDNEVDAINRQMYSRVFERIRQRPDDVEALLSYLSAGRHLERIADYATNIAEDVTYMIEGSIVRHGRRRQDRSATTG